MLQHEINVIQEYRNCIDLQKDLGNYIQAKSKTDFLTFVRKTAPTLVTGFKMGRHIELLCDIITNKGILSPINRQGINRGDIGPLAKCSFEDTTDQLIKAYVFGELDKLNGVSSNIMIGQKIKSVT